MAHPLERLARAMAKAPVHAYRWTLKPLVGWECRHLPTCSEYALEAIDRNGAWRGCWLALSRICRCHPWGRTDTIRCRISGPRTTRWRHGATGAGVRAI